MILKLNTLKSPWWKRHWYRQKRLLPHRSFTDIHDERIKNCVFEAHPIDIRQILFFPTPARIELAAILMSEYNKPAKQQMAYCIRRAQVNDVEWIMKIQRLNYSADLVEEAGVFESIVREHPNCCFVALEAKSARVVGFFIAHMWPDVARPPALNGYCIGGRDADKTNRVYYIHDLTIDPTFQELGIGDHLTKAFLASVKGDDVVVTLVAVHHSAGFWERHGFRKAVCCVDILATYGDPSAVYMTRRQCVS